MSDRYSRQTLFLPNGLADQERLGRSHVALIGCGALGTVIAGHLVRAGVGLLRIVDRDFIEASNLQRQTLFDEEDIRQPLAYAAANLAPWSLYCPTRSECDCCRYHEVRVSVENAMSKELPPIRRIVRR